MTVFEHFRQNAWKARDMGYPQTLRLTPRIIAQDRASLIQEAHAWRQRITTGTTPAEICKHARYEALLSAYSMRGVWP